MKIHFLGAAKTTTGSMHMLEVNGTRVLLDCGLYQGKRKLAFEKNRNLPFDPRSVHACVLSHAHIDHSGNIPTLVKNGFAGRIFATPATVDLAAIMLPDSAYLQEKDVEYVNRKRRRQGKNPFEPLYVAQDVTDALNCFQGVRYEDPRAVAPGVVVTFHDAGHILGSAVCEIEITENGATRRLLFTGDLGRDEMPILKDPVIVTGVDILITESTYGNRLHPKEQDVKAELLALCNKAMKHRSRMVIPAFSVGRTQQLLYFLHQLWGEGKLPEIPVYVDSPLSLKATKVHDDHPECFDRDMKVLASSSDEPFSMGRATFVQTLDQSKALNKMAGPVIIISASGMCEGGRILHHLKHTVEDRRNIILIVGYQAEHTLGRRLVHRRNPIKIFGEQYHLGAEVHSIQALSAHADRNDLLSYIRKMGPEVDHAFVVHGEPEQSMPFADALRKLGAKDVRVPGPGETAEI